MKRLGLLLVFLLWFALPVLADESPRHEELTPEQLGTVHFSVSFAEAVHKPFERGIALLHSFWYEEAEREFEQIGEIDRKCAMAHWGVAMSLWHQLWDEPTPATIKRGQTEINKAQSLPPSTARERDYISALSAF